VLIEPELADVFPGVESVNCALRLLLNAAQVAVRQKPRSAIAPKKRRPRIIAVLRHMNKARILQEIKRAAEANG